VKEKINISGELLLLREWTIAVIPIK